MSHPARPGAIHGRVTNAAGIGMEGVRIMLGGSSPEHNDLTQLSDADGSFALRGLPHGRYHVLAVADAGEGTISANARVDVQAGGAATVELLLGNSGE